MIRILNKNRIPPFHKHGIDPHLDPMCRPISATPIPKSLSISDDTSEQGIPDLILSNSDGNHLSDRIPFRDQHRVLLGLSNIRPYPPRLGPLRHPSAAHATAL